MSKIFPWTQVQFHKLASQAVAEYLAGGFWGFRSQISGWLRSASGFEFP